MAADADGAGVNTVSMRRRAGTVVTFLICLAAILLVPAGPAFAQPSLDTLLAKAAKLTTEGKRAEAYALLSAEEDTYIGDLKFDYALGRAALYAGHPASATIAFSRVLALDPGHAGALIDMGRAYLALGNRAQAQVAFENLLALDPPPTIRTQLLIYLAEARGERRRRVTARAYLDAFAGTSTNVNQAPSQSQIFVPAFQVQLQLADQNVRKPDSFTGVGGGADFALPVSGRYSLIGGAEFLSRRNQDERAFDVGGAAGSLGLAWSGDSLLARARYQAAISTLGGETSRKVQAFTLDVGETTIRPGIFGAFFGLAGIGTYRHPSADLRVFDADFITIGGGATSRVGEKSTLSVMLLAGQDTDKGGNPSGDRTGWGLRLAYDQALSTNVRFTALLGTLNSDYSERDVSFLAKRADRRLDLELTLRFKLSSSWEARLEALRSIQESNIPIYEFQRTDWTMGLRYQFD